MNHQKEQVLPAASGMWPEILQSLTDINSSIFNERKEHPCPICGGKTRFRYIKSHDMPFFCNSCGSKSGIQFLMAESGLEFRAAINAVGDWLNLVPQERIETLKKEHQDNISMPNWYKYDRDKYEATKAAVKVDLSPWQRISGLNMIDILSDGDNALIPLLKPCGSACDFVLLDAAGNWQTTQGNKAIPPGFHSSFGERDGKRKYIAVSPFHAAHASAFMGGIFVICAYEVSNILPIIGKLKEDPVMIVTSVTEMQEADDLKLKQLTYDKKTNRVNRRLWEAGEIAQARG